MCHRYIQLVRHMTSGSKRRIDRLVLVWEWGVVLPLSHTPRLLDLVPVVPFPDIN